MSIVLRELACSQPTPLCKQWTDEWEDDSDIDVLIDKFVRGQDFCVINDYPGIDFIRKNFRPEDLERHNIYLDKNITIEDAENGYYVFLGDCKVTLVADGFKAITVYCRHDSEVNVRAFDGARVFVTYYDNSSGVCKSDEYSKVKIYKRNK